MKIDSEELDNLLKSTDIPNGVSGGCVSFAVALDNVIGVESYPCVFDPMDDSKPLHCMAVVDGVVFDANGSSGKDPEIVKEWWSGLKTTDFPCVSDKAEETGRYEWDLLEEYLEQEHYNVFDNKCILKKIGSREDQVEKYEQILRDNL